jgi:hypothetical protein
VTWFADLAPLRYFGDHFANCLAAVGWLERGQPFPTGAVDASIYSQLKELLRNPWQPFQTLGFHSCDLCLYEGPTGTANLFLPDGDRVLVCPELIVHFMNAHAYQPPERFCRAVMACPPMRSMPYLQSLLAAGRPLVQASHLTRGCK